MIVTIIIQGVKFSIGIVLESLYYSSHKNCNEKANCKKGYIIKNLHFSANFYIIYKTF